MFRTLLISIALTVINHLNKLYEAWDKPEEAQKYRDLLPEEDTPTEDSE
jgi:hypothetical protein